MNQHRKTDEQMIEDRKISTRDSGMHAITKKVKFVDDEGVHRAVYAAPSTSEAFELDRVSVIDAEVEHSWRAAENGGWHKSWDKLKTHIQNASALNESYGRTAEDERNWVISKLFLIVDEITEAGGELRNGHELTEVYYKDEKGIFGPAGTDYPEQRFGKPDDIWSYTLNTPRPGDIPLLKPEGFLVELADAVIRIEDLVGIVTQGTPSFGQLKLDKIEFNATRGQMHGGAKF